MQARAPVMHKYVFVLNCAAVRSGSYLGQWRVSDCCLRRRFT